MSRSAGIARAPVSEIRRNFNSGFESADTSDRASRGICKAGRAAGVGPNGDASKYFSVCRGSKPDGLACCAFARTGDAIISAKTAKANLTVAGRRPAPDPNTAHP